VDLRNPGPDIGSQFRDGGHRAERDEQTGPQRRRRNGCQESCSLEISRSTSRARRATRSAWINRSVSMSCSAAGTPADHRPARRRAQGMTFYRSDRPHPREERRRARLRWTGEERILNELPSVPNALSPPETQHSRFRAGSRRLRNTPDAGAFVTRHYGRGSRRFASGRRAS